MRTGGRRSLTVAIDSLTSMSGGRIEQRALVRSEQLPADTTLVVRGGRDAVDKLRVHAERTARAWSLDGQPLLGISVSAVLGMPLEVLLRRRFASFRTIYLPTAGELSEQGSSYWPPRSGPISRSAWIGPMTGNCGGCWPRSGPPGPIPSTLGLMFGERRAEMYRVDITADLNDEDQTGYLWTFLDEARDPAQIRPGALVVAGDEEAVAVCQVIDVVPAGDGTIVHLRPLPGLVDDYRALVERALAS
jgi:hypothetical protein